MLNRFGQKSTFKSQHFSKKVNHICWPVFKWIFSYIFIMSFVHHFSCHYNIHIWLLWWFCCCCYLMNFLWVQTVLHQLQFFFLSHFFVIRTKNSIIMFFFSLNIAKNSTSDILPSGLSNFQCFLSKKVLKYSFPIGHFRSLLRAYSHLNYR